MRRFFNPYDLPIEIAPSAHLSENFHLSEFTRSDTARRLGINNTPGPEVVENLRTLVNYVLQPARDYLGVPLRITSGYRSPELNRAVGGSKRSDHMFGYAADIETRPETSELMFALGRFIQQHCAFKQLIWEFGGEWIHVSYQEGANRGEVFEIYRGPSKPRRRPFSFLVDMNNGLMYPKGMDKAQP